MSNYAHSITVHASLSEHGDALLFAGHESPLNITGLRLKQLLFAYHEASWYGGELEIKVVQETEIIILPAEHVIPFFAEQRLPKHIEWSWDSVAEQLIAFAQLLYAGIESQSYIPSYSAFSNGKLRWIWDDDDVARRLEQLKSHPDLDSTFTAGLQASYSAAVNERYYSTEAAAADLRTEYPLLFTKDHRPLSGLDEQAWLIAVGWSKDHAPFRPALQLVEPEGENRHWQLRLVVQDKLDPTIIAHVLISAAGEVRGAWPSAWSGAIHERAAGWLNQLRLHMPGERFNGRQEDLLDRPLSSDEAWRFINDESKHLLDTGWQVLLPAWWEKIRRIKPRLRAKLSSETGSSRESLFGLDSLVDFDWRISIGDASLTEAEFEQLAERNERLVQFRGQWILLNPGLLEQIRQMMQSIDSSQRLSFQDVLQLHLLESRSETESGTVTNGDAPDEQLEEARAELGVELNEHLIKLMSRLNRQTKLPDVPVPTGLQADLRAYQREGFSWLVFLRRYGLGACLADDMGLGKTVQLIAYLLQSKDEGMAGRSSGGGSEQSGALLPPSLIICPTSVLGNWQKELRKFAPSLNVITHYGSGRLGGNAFHEALDHADVILTSYATATLDQELLRATKWAAICLDEAQNIKNAQTKQSAAVRSLRAAHRIALTGTPIENRLSELWSIYDFINPGFLGTSHGFQKRFAAAIEKGQDAQRTADLQRLVKPFMLRRKKKDPAIQLDLPDKNEMKTYIHLTAEQAALYSQTVNHMLERMKNMEGIERKGAILAAITHLKQICDHPALLEKASSEPAASAAAEEDKSAYESLISRSAKLERLLDMIRELREEGERCLVFTQYVGMGHLLQQVLRHELGEQVLYLNGSTSKTARDRMIASFQSDSLPAAEQPNVFILSIKAGGVGLNLTAANHVFHFDRWWNPAVENQATDRAFRIGQTRDVQVHKFISLGTLEERIDEMIDQKQQLSENVISSSESWITELSTDELKELFTLRQE